MQANKTPIVRPYKPEVDEKNIPKATDQIIRINSQFVCILKMLIEAGCEVDHIENTFGMTALDFAILNGDVESSAHLVCAGADPDHLMKLFAASDIYSAIVHGKKKELINLLTYDQDLDLNLPFSCFSVTHKSGETGVGLSSADDTGDEGLMPIAVAVRSDDPDYLRTLLTMLSRGAQINAMGPAGRSALHEATRKGLTNICEFLITHGASMEQPAPGFLNCTPVVIAVIMKHRRIVEFFLTVCVALCLKALRE